MATVMLAAQDSPPTEAALPTPPAAAAAALGLLRLGPGPICQTRSRRGANPAATLLPSARPARPRQVGGSGGYGPGRVIGWKLGVARACRRETWWARVAPESGGDAHIPRSGSAACDAVVV